MHLVLEYRQKLWWCTAPTRIKPSASSTASANVCDEGGVTVFMNGREIHVVQILSDFKVSLNSLNFQYI